MKSPSNPKDNSTIYNYQPEAPTFIGQLKKATFLEKARLLMPYELVIGIILVALVISTMIITHKNPPMSPANNIVIPTTVTVFKSQSSTTISGNKGESVEVGQSSVGKAQIPVATSVANPQSSPQYTTLPGKKLISVMLRITDNSDSILVFNTENVQLNAGGSLYSSSQVGDQPFLTSSTLAPTQSIVGFLNYIVPDNIGSYTLQIMPNSSTGKLTIIPVKGQ